MPFGYFPETEDVMKTILVRMYKEGHWREVQMAIDRLVAINPDFDSQLEPVRIWMKRKYEPMPKAEKVAMMELSHWSIDHIAVTIVEEYK
jgi:hypothetical protein